MNPRQTTPTHADRYRTALFGDAAVAMTADTLVPPLRRRFGRVEEPWRAVVVPPLHRVLADRPEVAQAPETGAWRQQHRSLRRLVSDMPSCEERRLLLALCDLLDVPATRQSASPEFLRARRHYAEWLDARGRTAEALALFALSHQPSWGPVDQPSLGRHALMIARLQRRLARWGEARTAYTEARRIGVAIGDADLVLDAELGLVQVMTGRGNLPKARQQLARLRADAAAAAVGPRVAHRLALFDGVLASRCGQHAEALARFVEAGSVAPTSDDALLALGNAGTVLAACGDAAAAERIHAFVRNAAQAPGLRHKALIELLPLCFRRAPGDADPLLVELIDAIPVTTPSLRIEGRVVLADIADLLGRPEAAADLRAAALEEAEEYRLNEWIIRLESRPACPPAIPRATPDVVVSSAPALALLARIAEQVAAQRRAKSAA